MARRSLVRFALFMAMALACTEAVWAQASLPSTEKIQQLLAERMAHDGVGIVVGVIDASGTRVIVHGKSGAKDGRPLDGDTVFQTGSLSKAFVSLVLSDMVLRGEVKLDDAALKYLPEGIGMPTYGDSGEPIRLVHLSTHTSGLPSMPDNLPVYGEPTPIEGYTVDGLYEFLSTYKLTRAPGEKSEYSNVGVALLGRLLGRRANMDYEVLLKQRVLEPLGMRSTAITVTPEMAARLAPGHGRYLTPVNVHEMRAMPASGSLRSTANDLLRYLAAHLGYLDSPLKSAMELQRTTRFPEGSMTALAWAAQKFGEDEVFWHDGAKSGYRSALAFNVKDRKGSVVLMNYRSGESARTLALHLVAGRPLPPPVVAPQPHKIVAVDGKTLESFAGRYEPKPGSVMTVIAKRGFLLIDEDRDGGAEFYPTGERDFFLDYGNDELSFDTDASGRVTALRHYPNGKEEGTVRVARRLSPAN